MADKWRQFRLLLWKDYLIRKRKLITLFGIIWATLVMFSLYSVRVNIDNQDFPTCQFAGRALPSAGMLTFLQSFICSVGNECEAMDKYEEIPAYNNSRLSQIQSQFTPLVQNESVIEVAAAVPDALKLLGTMSSVVDEPTFLQISEKGLRMRGLFRDPMRVRRYAMRTLNITGDAIDEIMDAEISFSGIIKGHTDRCNSESLSETLQIKQKETVQILVAKLCPMTDKQLQSFLMNLIIELDFSKYVKMLGNMYSKLNGDSRITVLGDTLSAVLRMSNLQSFVPPELVTLLMGSDKEQFRYYNLTIISKVLDLYEPTFGSTEAFQTIRGVADGLISGVQWFYKLLKKRYSSSSVDDVTGLLIGRVDSELGTKSIEDISFEVSRALDTLKQTMTDENFLTDVFDVLPKLSNFILRWLSKKTKHDALFYSTLIAKLIEGTSNIIKINMDIEEISYNVTKSHPKGLNKLTELPVGLVGRAFDALTDAERTQTITTKLNTPNQMFCDAARVQKFFKSTKEEASIIMKSLCTEEFNEYITDLISSFGIYDVKKMINELASLFIQETLGKDTSSQLYTIEQCFEAFRGLIDTLVNMQSKQVKDVNWSQLLNLDNELMEALKEKVKMTKEILITVHGCLAKEVVKSNTILELRLTPVLKDATTFVLGLNAQLESANKETVELFKKMYPKILETMLRTLLDEEKTYKLLSTHSVDMFCNDIDIATKFFTTTAHGDNNNVVKALCEMSIEIEKGMQSDSPIGQTIRKLQNSTQKSLGGVDWARLINGLKVLYTNLYQNHPYVFEYKSYNMDEEMRQVVNLLLKETEEFWFGSRNLSKAIQLSINALFRLLDTADRDIFNLSSHDFWLRIKHSVHSANGLLVILDEIVNLINAISNPEQSYTGALPPTTVQAVKRILPNLPQLIVDAADLIRADDTELDPIIFLLNASPPWPCSNASISSLLNVTGPSKEAVTGFEALLCLDSSMRQEWEQYAELEKVKMITSYNKTDLSTLSPHVFLNMSSNFDALVRDSNSLKTTLDQIFAKSEDNGTLTLKGALEYAVQSFNTSDRNVILRSLMTKIDTVLQRVDTSSISEDSPLNTLWEAYAKCVGGEADCLPRGRAAWRRTLMLTSTLLQDVAARVRGYVMEIYEPNATLIQTLGFTKNTGLYILYDKIADFIGVLLNSYWDYGFMNQIRRASKSPFWDCEALVEALVIPPGSRVTPQDLRKVKPFICPSLFYWLSLPRGENTLLDLISVPQYYFYTLPSKNLTSNFLLAMNEVLQFNDYISGVPQPNVTEVLLMENEVKLDSIAERFNKLVDKVVNWKVKEDDASYILFNEINRKKFISSLYLTKIVSLVSKVQESIENFNAKDMDISKESKDKLEADVSVILKKFQRRPTEAIALHFDLITKLLWEDDNFTLTKAIEDICNKLANNKTVVSLLAEDTRFVAQICARNYSAIYKEVQKGILEDYGSARDSLQGLFKTLNSGKEDVVDVFDSFDKRPEIKISMKTSLKYADDLGTQVYLKYLQTNLKHYSVILSFLSGEDWWAELRRLYRGPYASNFFDTLEKSLEIADDLLKNADSIHLVRLLRDINLNDTAAFCQHNVTLSDYIPDATGLLSILKQQACDVDSEDVFAEMPIMVIVSQGYDNSLTLSKDVDYAALYEDLKTIESKLEMVRAGPKSPITPSWITEDGLEGLRKTARNLVSKEMIVKMSFGVLTNVADGATLFLNSSECQMCSAFTSWFKQLNLQLYKKQEYDTLLCMLDKLTPDNVYSILNIDFHWDMAIRELISIRNYTKYELNKSVNEFLGQVKLHLLDDMNANETKLVQCLVGNVSRNDFGNATLFIKVLARTIKLVRAQVPHLSEIPGFKSLKFVQQMYTDITNKLPVVVKMIKLMEARGGKVMKELGSAGDDLKNANVDLLVAKHRPDDIFDWLKLPNGSVALFCQIQNCTQIGETIMKSIDQTWLDDAIQKTQEASFWSFNFIAKILDHFERSLNHVARLVGIVSKVDVAAAMEGKIAAILDFLLQILQDGDLTAVIYSIQGMAEELRPLLRGTPLDFDLEAMVRGLKVIADFKRYVIEDLDLKVSVSQLIATPDRLEHDFSSLGINNTNFWSLSAPRVHAGHIDLKPLLTTIQQEYRISNFVCQSQMMSQLILPSNVDVVTLDDIYGAIVEQFCGLDDEVVRKMVPAIMASVNYTFVMDKLTKLILTQVYKASNLTEAEGTTVVALYPQMAALLPVVHKSVADVATSFADEPMFEALKDFHSVDGLLSSPDFLRSAGNMLCGKPFAVDSNRLFKAVIDSQDFSNQPDPMQLEALPTDFCRSLYTDILSMSGGKIVWSLVKPLLMGRILYTPPTPEVQRIIHQANASFSQAARLTSILHNFAASFSSIHQLSEHRAGLQALRKVVGTLGTGGVVPGGDQGGNQVDFNEIFSEFGDLNSIENLLGKASDLLHCVNLNRFQAAPSEDKLANEAVKLTRINEFSAGIVFLDVQELDGLPHNVSYKIRMDIDTVPTTSRKRNQFWTPGPEANFLENLRYFRGFVQIQDLIDNAIIDATSNYSNGARRKRHVAEEMQADVYTQEFPYPCYRKDYFQSSLYESQALIVAFFVAFVFSVASAIRFIVSEREAGITVLLSVMGVSPSLSTLSWLTCSIVELSVTSVCVSAVLSASVLPRTDYTLLLALVLLFCLSHLMFCYMISKLFKSASLASVCGGLLYMVTFMPYVIILALEAQLSYGAKILTCLSMSSAFSYTLQHIGRLEATGIGAHWSHLTGDVTAEEGGLLLSHAVLMIVVDTVLYLCVGWLIDRFTGLKTIQSNITYTPSSSEKAGVSIVNISAVYQAHSRRQKVALEQVSIELHQGCVTTLLGHNGAGKTTLIKVITGMVKATTGHISVRGKASARPQVGLCPQHDVLYEQLTAREHLTLYTALKSTNGDSVKDEVDRLSRSLSLGAWADAAARRLSGGLRRRVCVALAFAAAPPLVLLDEPSAPVDPTHRREIWSMIMRLKEERTVLMSTHLLDEAELLSDQIVIMHKGQVHTSGSPMDIKRTFGNGYTLTALYPTHDLGASMEDLAQGLLDAARSIVMNAQLLQVEETKVEVALPMYSADGVSNDFLQLCSTIESRQQQLGYSSFSLEGSSLEHALHNVCDAVALHADGGSESATKSSSASSASVRTDESPLVSAEGTLKGTHWEQFCAVMHKRYTHYKRNKWLLFLTFVVPSLFVTIAMAFSMIRPPADNEIALLLTPAMYDGSTQFVVSHPSGDNSLKSSTPERVMAILSASGPARNWTSQDNPSCKCSETRQECDYTNSTTALPTVMILPDAVTANQWLISSQEAYIEKRYAGYSTSTKAQRTHYIAWYNNKGHHALPAAVNALNAARLNAARGPTAGLRTYSHPLKISKEQLSKSTLLQHVADAGISGLVLVSWCLVPAGCACLLVHERTSSQRRLLALAAVPPALLEAADLALALVIVLINIGLSACVLGAFGFPVFVARDNLPAICLLLLLYGWSCGSLVSLASRRSRDASVCAMLTFCANVFVGLAGLALILILDIISESQRTDDARWLLHKVLLCAPQFALGDALLEIAKNTVQAQVLSRFGMDTYKSPLWSDLIVHHYAALFLLGVLFTLLNVLIEYGLLEDLFSRVRRPPPAPPAPAPPAPPAPAVRAERARVMSPPPFSIATIQKGYSDSAGNMKKHQLSSSTVGDALSCVSLSHVYPRQRLYALNNLTLGLPRGECTALLGENGSGKSTLFSILTGSLRASGGHVAILDAPATTKDFRSGRISYCPQTDAIDPLLTVRETLDFYCRIRGIKESTKVISRTLETFELCQYAAVRTKALSGGNKRKLCAAIAFMSRCPIILLDEPTSGMDPVSRGCVSRGAASAQAAGAAVLVSTHGTAGLVSTRGTTGLVATGGTGWTASGPRLALMHQGELRALLHPATDSAPPGYAVLARCTRRRAARVWRAAARCAPALTLLHLHHDAIHFIVHTSKEGAAIGEQPMKLSDIFRLLAELQSAGDLEDYTLNQSSLEQMFLNDSNKELEEQLMAQSESLPTPPAVLRRDSIEHDDTVTSL